MARSNLVQIGDFYFTSNGEADGTRCRVKINGIADIVLETTGQTIVSANGTPWTQVVDVGRKGNKLDFSFDFIDKDLHEDIRDFIQNLIDNRNTTTLNITGDTGNYTLTVKPFLPGAVDPTGEFSGGILKGVTYRFITT